MDRRAVRGGGAGADRPAALRPLHLGVRALPGRLRGGRPWLMGLVLALLAVAFVSSDRPPQPDAVRARRRRAWRVGEEARWPLVPLAPVRGGARRPRAHAAGAARDPAGADRGDRRADDALDELAGGSGRAVRRPRGRRAAVAATASSTARSPPGGRAGAGEVAAHELRRRAALHGRRRPAAGPRGLRGPLSVRPRPGELVPPRHRRAWPPDRARDRLAGHVPLPGVALRAGDLRSLRDPRRGPSRSPAAGPPRVLARRLLPPPQGRGAAGVPRRRPGLPVHRGGRRGRVRDPGGARSTPA